MKALVTGGAGFIGSNIVYELLRQNCEVRVVDDLSSGYISNLEPQMSDIEFINADVSDASSIRGVAKGVDVVYHLAASVGNKRSIDNPIRDSQINVIGTLNILQEMVAHNVPKIVASSSAGIYGELRTLPIVESHPIEPNTPYAASKLCEEKQCLAYAHLYDIEAICLRYFNVYGTNQRFDAYGNVIPIFAFNMVKGQGITIFGDGEQTRDFVNVADVVQANIKAGQAKGVSGAFNIASATNISINRLIALLEEASGIKPQITYGDKRPGDVLHSLADISMAHDKIGYVPAMSLEIGLRDYMNWVKQESGRELARQPSS